MCWFTFIPFQKTRLLSFSHSSHVENFPPTSRLPYLSANQRPPDSRAARIFASTANFCFMSWP